MSATTRSGPARPVGMGLPAERYRPSLRALPAIELLPEYPQNFKYFTLASNGCIKRVGAWIFVGQGLCGWSIGLAPATCPAQKRKLFFFDLHLASLHPPGYLPVSTPP